MDQHTCCQHAESESNHRELLQGTRAPGKMGSDAAQIPCFLLEGEAELAPCSPLSSPLHRTALGSDKLPHPSLPPCHTAILALAPRAPLFFLVIQTHHQSPLPIPKLLMPAILKCSTPGSLIHQLRNSLAWCSPNRSKQIKTSQTREL